MGQVRLTILVHKKDCSALNALRSNDSSSLHKLSYLTLIGHFVAYLASRQISSIVQKEAACDNAFRPTIMDFKIT